MKKLRILHNIMRTTLLYETLIGFLLYYFLTALIIWLVEPEIGDFGDSLWFCFAACTTVGFGDVVATSTLARILTVILTLYGILVVAFIPGVIVSYVTEFHKAKSNESLTVFLDKLENLENLSKEELKEISTRVKSRRNKL